MNIAVSGTGYVGMTIATSLAQQNETGTCPHVSEEFIPNFEHEEKGKNLDQKM